ncbi:zinc finger protein ZAT5-like [Typha angustifolia]|uniref:zinc finger protein ZAT5-like n=1 Tax=Typha angustifolia TaxID=59011 RepID=UPI003C2B2E95
MELQELMVSSSSSPSSTNDADCMHAVTAVVKSKRTKQHRIQYYSAEEDEDMANCLILLARGCNLAARSDSFGCKSCSRSFPSAQALGGHRASCHRKKLKRPPAAVMNASASEEMLLYTSEKSTPAPKVHECMICGSEFNSGQALGGHMRRHRPLAVVPESQELIITKEERSATHLSFDLNLPAPPDEEAFTCAGGRPSLLFPPSESASALVDCHY